MAKNNKKSVLIIIIVMIMVVIAGFIIPLMQSLKIKKHACIDSWHQDLTTSQDVISDQLDSRLQEFYNQTGYQAYVVAVDSENAEDIEDVYDDLFYDNEHVLIYIVKNGSQSPKPGVFSGNQDSTYYSSFNDYSIEIYAARKSIDSLQKSVLRENIDNMNPERSISSELIKALDNTIEEYQKNNNSLIITKVIWAMFSIIPTVISSIFTLVFIWVFVKFVKKVNNSSNQKPAKNSAPYPAPTVSTLKPTSSTPAKVPEPKTSNPTVKVSSDPKPVAPKPQPVSVNTSPVATPTLAKPAPTPIISEVKPKTVPEAKVQMPVEKIHTESTDEIKPNIPTDIKPIDFDLDANNILDNLGDTNYDIPSLIDTDFNDWGNL